MPTEENVRLRIRQHFIELMDEQLADAIMESMPPIPWTDLATKNDITRLELRFDSVDSRFDTIDARFESMEARFDTIDARFESMEARFDSVGSQFESVGSQFESVGSQFESMEARFDALGTELHSELSAMEGRLSMRFMETTRMVIFAVMMLMTAVLGIAIAVITTT